MPKAPQRYPRRLNKTFQAAHLPRDHSYSTLRPSNPTRGKANYKLAVFCSLTAVAATWAVTAPSKPERLDASPRDRRDSLTSGAKVEITGKDHGDDVDKSSTGTSTVPYFPRTIWLPRSGRASEEGKSPALPAGIGVAQEEEEYKLLGLGIRKVSFLRIQVYVVGLYVAKSDIGRLQEELVRASVGSGASTLVQGEKQELRKVLLDGDGSMKIWSEVLKKGGVRSAVRVVPTRNTNFSHLRDGWLRGIDLRGKGREFEGEDFQAAVDAFKGMLGGRGSVGKGKVLLLGRGADGALRAWAEDEAPSAESPEPKQKAGGMSLLGTVKDERISRLVWMGYLTGENVASEEARQSVVNGVMEIVERPVGTVETQVV
ncbi:Altered inheritance of mitochondria protein 18 mitochondrial [Mycoblastus sanguinarius]|nr:Altered inheritance of mitochondria protein 18 mitochondrial [Mycoblastus sanguinarius]